MYSVIDLFAGAGGLSLGFLQTGKFDIKVAFENSPYMQKTYCLNHPDVKMYGDVCSADYVQIQKDYGKIDIVIGGPPCQGFSNANRQKNHVISKNNMLVKQYIRAIMELQPKAFVMENVSMLKSEVHRFYLEKGDESLVEKYNIPIKATRIILLEKRFSFPGILEIVCNSKEIESHLWPEKHYYAINVIYKACKNPDKLRKALSKYKDTILSFVEDHIHEYNPDDCILNIDTSAFLCIKSVLLNALSDSELKACIEPAIMIQRMLSGAKEIHDNNIVIDAIHSKEDLSVEVRSFAVFDFIKAVLGAEHSGYSIKSKVLCAADFGAPQKRMRFVLIGIKRDITESFDFPQKLFDEKNYRTVYDAIGDLENVTPVTELVEDVGISLCNVSRSTELQQMLGNSPLLRNHITTKTTDVAMERFKAIKQGQNFHSLSESLKVNTYTDAARTQNTIYLRLNYKEPCGTVVNVRKSMWIHPVKDRAISVREAARLQTFPDSFIFCGTKDKQYQQVGNAVPPILAKAIADNLASILDKQHTEESENGQK